MGVRRRQWLVNGNTTLYWFFDGANRVIRRRQRGRQAVGTVKRHGQKLGRITICIDHDQPDGAYTCAYQGHGLRFYKWTSDGSAHAQEQAQQYPAGVLLQEIELQKHGSILCP